MDNKVILDVVVDLGSDTQCRPVYGFLCKSDQQKAQYGKP